MPDVDPYSVTYPEVEERMSLDVFPGLMFCFHNRGNAVANRVVWTVVAVNSSGEDEGYLLLGSTGVLVQHDGKLGKIRRIMDPVPVAPWRREANERELAMQLADDALALGA